jgi:two-component system, cell cycle sensor histidine kinase and response regulator CckA
MPIPNSFDILQAVIEATPDAIFVKDLEGRYVVVNEAAARFLGRRPADIVGKHDLELYPEETARKFIEDDQQVLASGSAQSFEGVAASDYGTQAYLVTKGVYRDRDGQILGLYGISHDITALREAQDTLEHTRQALFRSQKMEAVGQLTGGIAHDFNNILVVILGNLELLKMRLRHDPHAHELIDPVLRAAERGQELIAQLLAFSRGRQLNPEPVDINALVESIVRLLGRTLGATITITTATSPDAGVALVDAAALEAAIVNIALNARDAMAPHGGTLTIRTQKVDIAQPATTTDDVGPGAYTLLALEDTGCGMAPEIVARVFEPFFTTKSGHGGTGLGLSMVYGFAKQSGGNVTIDSSPGRGTTVRLLLPRATDESKPRGSAETSIAPAVASRTILLVEDEAAVRTTMRRQLETIGHRVLVADAAPGALDIVGTEVPIDVLLTDVVLGNSMTGVELAEVVRSMRPSLPVIFMSGYAAVPEGPARLRDTGTPFLSKPATLSQLEDAVAAVCAKP